MSICSLPPLRKILTSSQFHAYEGYPLDSVVYPIRLMAALGIQDVISAVGSLHRLLFSTDRQGGLVVTNAAGSLKSDVPVGTSAFIPHTTHIIDSIQRT